MIEGVGANIGAHFFWYKSERRLSGGYGFAYESGTKEHQRRLGQEDDIFGKPSRVNVESGTWIDDKTELTDYLLRVAPTGEHVPIVASDYEPESMLGICVFQSNERTICERRAWKM